MIDSKELRIGNYFIDFENIIFKWDLDHFDLMINHVADIDEIIKSPIAIDEQILLKFGAFHIEGWTWGFEIDDITTLSVTYAEGKYYWSLRQFDLKTEINMFHLIDVNFLYLHQLQNLYFALTQKELEYVGTN